MPDFRWRLKYQSSYEAPTSTGGGEFTIEYPNKYHEIYTDTICRYTELTYKDGTKAWEGDVIIHESDLYGDAKGIIIYGKFNGKYIGFYIEWESKYHDLNNSPLYWIDKVKCIGNVVDNPELLEVE